MLEGRNSTDTPWIMLDDRSTLTAAVTLGRREFAIATKGQVDAFITYSLGVTSSGGGDAGGRFGEAAIAEHTCLRIVRH